MNLFLIHCKGKRKLKKKPEFPLHDPSRRARLSALNAAGGGLKHSKGLWQGRGCKQKSKEITSTQILISFAIQCLSFSDVAFRLPKLYYALFISIF